MKNIPQRMCIACREMKPKNEMIRVVRSLEGEISLDFTGKKNGRGAYVCDGEACIKKLQKSKLLNRTFAMQIEDSIYAGIVEAYLAKK